MSNKKESSKMINKSALPSDHPKNSYGNKNISPEKAVKSNPKPPKKD